ncbi:MAG: hypothetical protein ACI8X5_002817 [Planctomycetota bacterium]|jgi:hypothetical protein
MNRHHQNQAENATTTPEFLRLEGVPIVTELFYELEESADMERLELAV